MKKTVLAFAVAAAMGVPAVAAADVTLYGRFNVSLDNIDNGANKGTQLANNSSRIGVRGSEDLGGGLQGIFGAEFGLWNGGAQQTTFGGSWNARNTFVGVSGDFGEVRVGRHDTPYKLVTTRLNFFADMIGDMYNLMGTAGTSSNATSAFYSRADNTIMYTTPNFEGFRAMASYTTDRRNDRADLATAGDEDGYSLAATYTNGPIYVAAAYERWNQWTSAPLSGAGEVAHGDAENDAKAFKIAGTYTIDDLTLAAQYERVDTGAATNSKRNGYHLGARYNLGQAYLMGSFTSVGDYGTDDGATMYALGAGYNLSRRTGVYANYAVVDNDTGASYGFTGTGKGEGIGGTAGQDTKGFSIGMWHNF